LARKHRIAALEAAQEDERRRERGERGLEAPAGLQIPTKIFSVGRGEFELRADLEDEYFGGFDRKQSDHDVASSGETSHFGSAKGGRQPGAGSGVGPT
jgi:hypothetical protein